MAGADDGAEGEIDEYIKRCNPFFEPSEKPFKGKSRAGLADCSVETGIG
jgi:hypothetical protein